jgi:hypothetical protein
MDLFVKRRRDITVGENVTVYRKHWALNYSRAECHRDVESIPICCVQVTECHTETNYST